MAGSRVGELAIGRASVILKAEKVKLDIVTIRNEPDHAGLLGAAHLAPAWIFKGHDAALAADIGGTHIRAGLLALNLKRDPTLAKARVLKHESWRHVDDKPGRDEAVDSLIRMLKRMVKRAEEERLHLAPFIGIGCPGVIMPDGSIERGRRIFRATGKAAASICRRLCTKRYPGSVTSTPQSSCTMTRWCRVSAKFRSCRTSRNGPCSPSAPVSATRYSPTGIAISPAIPRHW